MMVGSLLPALAGTRERDVGDAFIFQELSEALHFGASVAEDKDFRLDAVEIGSDGVFTPYTTDSSLDVCVLVTAGPALVFGFKRGGEMVEMWGGQTSEGWVTGVQVRRKRGGDSSRG